MYERMLSPRLPGLGLAPAMTTRDTNSRQRDALLRDALAREQETYREPCPPAERFDAVRRPVRAGAA
ncbi:MAG TPA: hypothetical protein VFP19_05525 [Candidatus Limnocylindrales bacterium]|nr:hypothetical protein [Candidatus Limnocylindrales bacterium]